jgi:ribonuclease HI
MILNVDGSSLGNPDVLGFRGLIQNSECVWIQGFVGNIGFSNILHAELLGVYYGLAMVWEIDCSELWCYSDSKLAIKLISEPVNTWYHYAAILHHVKEILARDWQVHLLHTLREGNAYVDYLDKKGARNLEGYTPIVVPPVEINFLLLAYASGVSFIR